MNRLRCSGLGHCVWIAAALGFAAGELCRASPAVPMQDSAAKQASPATDGDELVPVSPPSEKLRREFKLADHYAKCLMVRRFPIVASAFVPDAALYEAAAIVGSMLVQRPDVLDKLADNRIRLAIMSVEERTCDVPEHADLEPASYWNRRARGLGATRHRPAVSCGEENLLHNPGDPYSTESILVHEFAHAIHLMAVADLDPTFNDRLERAFQSAIDGGLWKDKYAAENKSEYFAEAAQSWFDTNRQNDREHNHVNTREELREYDPGVAKLCEEVFGDIPWRYVRSDSASRQAEPHLRSLNRSQLKPFAWEK